MGSLAQEADSLDFVRPQPQGEFRKQRENPRFRKVPALPMSSLLSSYLTSSYSLGPQWLLPVGIPYPSWPSWHAGQSSGHSFKCGFLINRETPVRQEGVQARILYVVVIYRLLGMNTSTEMAWSKIPFLRKSLNNPGRDSCDCTPSFVSSFHKKMAHERLHSLKTHLHRKIFKRADGD